MPDTGRIYARIGKTRIIVSFKNPHLLKIILLHLLFVCVIISPGEHLYIKFS